MLSLVSLLAFSLLASRAVLGQVVGKPAGFGSGATGGGSIDPVTPSTTEEYVAAVMDVYLLTTQQTRVLLDR